MADESPLDAAREEARQTAREMAPGSTEIDHLVDGMYELEGILIGDEDCDVACVSIMFDEAGNRYVLVEEPRRSDGQMDVVTIGAERITARAALLEEIDLKIMMAFGMCDVADEAAATWAAIDSSAAQSARMRVEELGGDVDSVMQSVHSFFLEHPEF